MSIQLPFALDGRDVYAIYAAWRRRQREAARAWAQYQVRELRQAERDTHIDFWPIPGRRAACCLDGVYGVELVLAELAEEATCAECHRYANLWAECTAVPIRRSPKGSQIV